MNIIFLYIISLVTNVSLKNSNVISQKLRILSSFDHSLVENKSIFNDIVYVDQNLAKRFNDIKIIPISISKIARIVALNT